MDKCAEFNISGQRRVFSRMQKLITTLGEGDSSSQTLTTTTEISYKLSSSSVGSAFNNTSLPSLTFLPTVAQKSLTLRRNVQQRLDMDSTLEQSRSARAVLAGGATLLADSDDHSITTVPLSRAVVSTS
ncbi:hypothetical protein CEXT_174821 [Caerostris extrusa]|uniref:Uncharacterized protein n=1 Tax=Caerostris extrusa TaxID=172846 RepID=A0AAV4U2Z2_CAEEX|nr:hypothetical protein CEXT_174821 [Caerostris extrusa]